MKENITQLVSAFRRIPGGSFLHIYKCNFCRAPSDGLVIVDGVPTFLCSEHYKEFQTELDWGLDKPPAPEAGEATPRTGGALVNPYDSGEVARADKKRRKK